MSFYGPNQLSPVVGGLKDPESTDMAIRSSNLDIKTDVCNRFRHDQPNYLIPSLFGANQPQTLLSAPEHLPPASFGVDYSLQQAIFRSGSEASLESLFPDNLDQLDFSPGEPNELITKCHYTRHHNSPVLLTPSHEKPATSSDYPSGDRAGGSSYPFPETPYVCHPSQVASGRPDSLIGQLATPSPSHAQPQSIEFPTNRLGSYGVASNLFNPYALSPFPVTEPPSSSRDLLLKLDICSPTVHELAPLASLSQVDCTHQFDHHGGFDKSSNGASNPDCIVNFPTSNTSVRRVDFRSNSLPSWKMNSFPISSFGLPPTRQRFQSDSQLNLPSSLVGNSPNFPKHTDETQSSVESSMDFHRDLEKMDNGRRSMKRPISTGNLDGDGCNNHNTFKKGISANKKESLQSVNKEILSTHVPRRRLTVEQEQILLKRFSVQEYLNKREMEELAEKLKIPTSQLRTWFGNRRSKLKAAARQKAKQEAGMGHLTDADLRDLNKRAQGTHHTLCPK